MKVWAVQLGEEKAVWRPHNNLPISEWACREAGERLFIRSCTDRKRSNGHKLKKGKFRLTVRVVRPWNRLIREAVDAPTLALFKTRLDKTLSNPLWWEVFLPVEEGVGTI